MACCNSHIPGENRAFDHIYDPIYTVSGEKDLWKLNSYAVMRYAPIQVLAKENLMFSNVPKTNRQIIIQKNDLLRHFRFKPGNEDYENLTSYTHISSTSINNEKKDPAVIPKQYITGTCRANYFHYPIHSTGTTKNAQNFKLQEQQQIHPNQHENLPLFETKEKHVSVQTIYRESSAQTRPYLPEAIIPERVNQEPEIIRIAYIIKDYKPLRDFEVRAIDRARKRREWELSLPKITSLKDVEKRRIVLEAFEWEEWLSREEEIEEIQNLRFDIVKQMMQKREKNLRKSADEKLENSIKRIEEYCKEKYQKLDNLRDRNLRKLEAKHQKTKENIVSGVSRQIKKYQQLDVFKCRKTKQKNYFHFLSKDLSNQLEDFSKQIDVEKFSKLSFNANLDRLAKPKQSPKEIQQGFCSEKNLKQLYESLKESAQEKPKKDKPKCIKEKFIKYLQEINAEIGVEEDEEAELAYQNTIYLQKIIKGRAIQIAIHRNLKTHRNIVKNYRSNHILSDIQELYPKKELIENIEIDNISTCNKKTFETSQPSSLVEERKLNEIFQFLDKELIKLQDQRKIHALYMLAERERIKREQIEIRTLQKQYEKRRECDEIYRNVIKSSSDTVTMYLENILMKEINTKSEIKARKEIQEIAKAIDHKANKMMSTNPQIKMKIENDYSETIIDIADNFLFPEIQKQLARENMKLTQRRYLHAAHEELYDNIDRIFDTEKSTEDHLLKQLITDICPLEELQLEINLNKNVALHEANVAIRKAIKQALNLSSYKTSVVNIVNDTLNKMLHPIINTNAFRSSSNDKILEQIILEVNEKLWFYALNKAKNEKSIISKEIIDLPLEGASIIPSTANLIEWKNKFAEQIKDKSINTENSNTNNSDIDDNLNTDILDEDLQINFEISISNETKINQSDDINLEESENDFDSWKNNQTSTTKDSFTRTISWNLEDQEIETEFEMNKDKFKNENEDINKEESITSSDKPESSSDRTLSLEKFSLNEDTE